MAWVPLGVLYILVTAAWASWQHSQPPGDPHFEIDDLGPPMKLAGGKNDWGINKTYDGPVGGKAAETTGVQENSVGDLPIFLTGLGVNCAMIVFFFAVFGVMRKRYPIVYAGNVQANRVPFEPSDSFFGWVSASFALRLQDVLEHAGLDQLLLLEFNHWAMGLLTWLMVPLLFVMGPLHWIFGGNRSGDDHLSKLGMANVVDNHPWLYWVHGGLVWFVVVSVQRFIYRGQTTFLQRRRSWLQAMPSPRSTTVLVQNIPETHCTDRKVKEYFDSVFEADVVKSVHVVKHTRSLLGLFQQKEDADMRLQEALFTESKTGVRPTFNYLTGSEVDAIKYYTEQSNEAAHAVKEERRKMQEAAKLGDARVFTANAFVTFKHRRDSEMALKVRFTTDDDKFVCERPPDPADVIFSDLQKNSVRRQLMTVIGYLLIALVFWFYMPAVLIISYITDLRTIVNHLGNVGVLGKMAADEDTLLMWNAMMGSMALTLFISFVPTFFVYIFSYFFVLKAEAWLQNRIQNWYFWFMVLYILLVTSVGSSVIDTANEIAESPFYLFQLLAKTLPLATHFYLNFIPLQWVTHAQYLCRPVQFMKFKAFSLMFEEAAAKELSEPEDQDYYGLGGRGARHSFIVVLALVFCSLTPLIIALGFVNCLMCRLVYGYLIAFAETRKPDLGGAFWVTNLLNIQRCMPIYIALMSGVLCYRDANIWPCIIAGASIIYWYWSFARFKTSFRWESLSMEDILANGFDPHEKGRATRDTYQQPELLE